MALTVVNADSQSQDVWGRQRVNIVNVTFDESYATGGESFAPAMVGMAEITFVSFSPLASGYVVRWDRAAAKAMVFGEEAVAAGGPLLEVAGTTDLSGLTAVAFVVGR